MNRNAWSPEERVEYDMLCAEALWYGMSTRERTDRYIAMLRDDEQAHRFYAKDCLDDALYRGAAAQLTSWRTRQKTGRIAVSHEGKVLSVRRVAALSSVTPRASWVTLKAYSTSGHGSSLKQRCWSAPQIFAPTESSLTRCCASSNCASLLPALTFRMRQRNSSGYRSRSFL